MISIDKNSNKNCEDSHYEQAEAGHKSLVEKYIILPTAPTTPVTEKNKMKKSKLKKLSSVIQVCDLCGKVDVYKGDKHNCDPEYQESRREVQEYYT